MRFLVGLVMLGCLLSPDVRSATWGVVTASASAVVDFGCTNSPREPGSFCADFSPLPPAQ